MNQSPKDLRETAENLRENRNHSEAGDIFTQAFYRYFGQVEYGKDVRTAAVGQGLYCLLSASICYRLGDCRSRARNRASQGVLTVTDLREYVTDEPALIGLLYEFQGDYECVRENETLEESYARAIEAYEKADHLEMWQGEPSFEWNYAFFIRVLDGANHQLNDDIPIHSSPVTRVKYKHDNFKSAIEDIQIMGEWDFDTTF